MVEELDAEEYKSDDQNLREDLCPYIFMGLCITIRNRDLFLHGQHRTVD